MDSSNGIKYSESLRSISKFDWDRDWIPVGKKTSDGILGRCSTLLNGKMTFFGGSVRESGYTYSGRDRVLIQQVRDCGLDRIGEMPIQLKLHTCNTFSFDVERAWICFTVWKENINVYSLDSPELDLTNRCWR